MEQMIHFHSHFATLTNVVQLVKFSLQMEDTLATMQLIAIHLIFLEAVKLETAKI